MHSYIKIVILNPPLKDLLQYYVQYKKSESLKTMKNVFIAVCFCININIKFFNPLMKCNTHLNYMLSTQSITFLGRFFQYFFYLQKVVQ